jgi:YHS domain-containing protein
VDDPDSRTLLFALSDNALILLCQGAKALKEETSDMKRLLHLLTVASITLVPLLAGDTVVNASDKQTLDTGLNTVANGQILLAQNSVPKEAKGSESAKVNVDGNGVILKGYDAVAFFEQGKPVKGIPAIRSTYQGATYLFASEADKTAFDKEPARYAPQYGGFCAYGVVKGALDDFEDLFVFTIYKGKLYLCGNQNALEIFQNNIDINIDTADTNWRQLTGA